LPRLNVILTPADLQPERIGDRAVAVFDVLRATTTITAALGAGVSAIRIFDTIEAAATAADGYGGDCILVGERNCLRPPGFDLGNSPGAFKAELHGGRIVFMSTTNGARAIVAAESAALLLAAALVNASATADRLIEAKLDITLLCAGTDGQPAMEDLLGAGAVIDALRTKSNLILENDGARIALNLFQSVRSDLRPAMADTTGGQNILAVGLEADIDFAARLDAIPIVGRVERGPLRVTIDR
jgi:2-phosphosulfolactate phosphatase